MEDRHCRSPATPLPDESSAAPCRSVRVLIGAKPKQGAFRPDVTVSVRPADRLSPRRAGLRRTDVAMAGRSLPPRVLGNARRRLQQGRAISASARAWSRGGDVRWLLLALFLFRAARPFGSLRWPDLAGQRLRLARLAAMPAFNFLPLGFAHSSRDKKVACLASSAALRSFRMRRRSSPACRSPSRPRWARLGNREQGELSWRTSAPSRRPSRATLAKS